MSEIRSALALYLITDEGQCGSDYFYESVEDALKGGVTLLQVREKDASSRYFYERAKILRTLTNKYQIPLIINDRVDIAMAVGADGVHVGQKDLPVEEVRRITNGKMLLGVTANTMTLAKEAEKAGADYLGCGAVFQTQTKQDANILSLDVLKSITANVSIPVVAIGGIEEKNAPELFETGIAGFAVSSGILASLDKQEAARKLKNIFLSF